MDNPILWLINSVLEIYLFFIVASAILSLLVGFNIVNRDQPLVMQIGMFLHSLTEPAYRRIRPYLPQMNGFDLTPLVLYLLVRFAMYCINWFWAHYLV